MATRSVTPTGATAAGTRTRHHCRCCRWCSSLPAAVRASEAAPKTLEKAAVDTWTAAGSTLSAPAVWAGAAGRTRPSAVAAVPAQGTAVGEQTPAPTTTVAGAR